MQTISPTKQFPVVVHRWFQMGGGWAFHPSQDGNIRQLADVLREELHRRDEGQFEVQLPDGCLLGLRWPDEDCPDPAARGRSPAVLMAAVLPAGLSEIEHKEILRCLRSQPLPTDEGPNPDLICALTDRFVMRANVSRSDRDRIQAILLNLEKQFARLMCSSPDRYLIAEVCVDDWYGIDLRHQERVTATDVTFENGRCHATDPTDTDWRFEVFVQAQLATLLAFHAGRDGSEPGHTVTHLYQLSNPQPWWRRVFFGARDANIKMIASIVMQGSLTR